MSTKDERIKLGTCPKCEKGEIVQGSIGYSCNYFKSIDDKCTFNIYKEYFGLEITEDLAIQLMKGEETQVFTDLRKQDGGTFSASLIYKDGFITPNFQNEILDIECPICEGEVEVMKNYYCCENYHNKDEEDNRLCSLSISKNIAGRAISREEVEKLLKQKQTPFLDGFESKEGKPFSSKLVLNDDGEVKFSSVICKCPQCGGDMYIGAKAYNCSNFRDEKINCRFSIWREISFREIKPEEAIALCENKITSTLKGFKNKEGSFNRKLTLNDDYKVVMI